MTSTEGTAVVPAQVATEAREVMQKHARTFSWAGALLPGPQLDRAAVVYSFCRLVDDLVDETEDPHLARYALDDLRAELTQASSSDPLVSELRRVLKDGDQSVAVAHELIDGVASDLITVRLADDAALHRYAYQVAGTVGLMMCAVLGVRSREALPFAVDLGVGMQLTNICRDVLEDAERGRVYLPATRLEQAGLTQERLLQDEPLTNVERQALSQVVLDLLEQAESYYASAELGMCHIPLRARLAIRVAARVYRAIGRRLSARGGDAWAGRTIVGITGKIRWTLSAMAGEVWSWFVPAGPHASALHRNLRGRPGCQV